MKKITIFLIMLVILMVLPISVLAAGSIQPSPRSLSITKGGTGKFNISASNACGKIEVYSSNPSVATVNVSNRWIENETVTVTVTGVSAGTAAITVRLSDAATFDEEELTGSYTVNVTVSEPQSNSGVVNNAPINNIQNNLSKNNKIGSLSIEGHELIKKDENTYELIVTHNVNNITINATPEDSKATITGTGIKNLEVGANAFEVIVTSESKAQNKYLINVIRKDAYYLEDLNNIIGSVDANPLDIIIGNDSKITQENLQKIKESQKIVNFNYRNEDRIIYSWIVNGAELESVAEMSTNINFVSEYLEEIGCLSNYADGKYMNFENIEQLPKNTKTKVYVGDKFKDGSLINAYYYNKDNNTLDTVNSGIMVSEGYIELEVKHSNYFLTRATIQNNISEEISKINIFMIIAIIEFIIIVVLIFINLKKKVK